MYSIFSADLSDGAWIAAERPVAALSTQVLALLQAHTVWASAGHQVESKVKLH